MIAIIQKHSAPIVGVNGPPGRDDIVRAVERALAEGEVAPGQPLPAIRALARVLEVSPGTVQAAYRVLGQKGLTEAHGRRGTRLRPSSAYRTPLQRTVPEGAIDLMRGEPDRRLLPKLPRLAHAQRLYLDAGDDPQLLELARQRFERAEIPAEHLALASGALDALLRVLELVARPGDRVIVEDPAFSAVLDLCAMLGLNAVPVPIDDEGFVPDALAAALELAAAAIIVTPRAQNPTGAALTCGRVAELRAVLDEHPKVAILEDDHAADVAGAEALTLVDEGTRRFAVIRSVSKSLGPDLRLAVMSLDPQTHRAYSARQRVGFRWVSGILQRMVVALWSGPATEAKLARATEAYAGRRDALTDALRARGIACHGQSGLNVWVPVPEETAVVVGLERLGWVVSPGERFRLDAGPGIRVTISTLRESDAPRFADDLARVLQLTK